MAHPLRTAGRDARVTGLVRWFITALKSGTDTSKVASWVDTRLLVLRHSWEGSTTESGTSRGLVVSGQALEGSRLANSVIGLIALFNNALQRAVVSDLARWTEEAIRASWLFRWLTAEPEPEVIVIDLRETVSVGPVITLLDQLIRWLVPASHRSTVIGAVNRTVRTIKESPVRVTSIVLGVGVLTNLVATLVLGEPTEAGVVVRVVLLGAAALGTRVTMTWAELTETRLAQLLITALEPPEPPDD